jgi:hypothetical protein
VNSATGSGDYLECSPLKVNPISPPPSAWLNSDSSYPIRSFIPASFTHAPDYFESSSLARPSLANWIRRLVSGSQPHTPFRPHAYGLRLYNSLGSFTVMGGLKSLAAVVLIKMKIVVAMAAFFALVVFTMKYLLGAVAGLHDLPGLLFKGNVQPQYPQNPPYQAIQHESFYGQGRSRPILLMTFCLAPEASFGPFSQEPSIQDLCLPPPHF